jgi:signal transduction histidine kinase
MNRSTSGARTDIWTMTAMISPFRSFGLVPSSTVPPNAQGGRPSSAGRLDGGRTMADNCTVVDEGRTVAGPGTDEIAELRASRRRLILAADAERSAIERAFHDGLQQLLVGLAADLELLSASVQGDPEAATSQLAGLRRDVRRALEEARTLAHRIHPALEAGGLGPALRLAAADAGVRIRIDVEMGRSVPAEIAAALYFGCLDVLGRVDGATTSITIREEGAAVGFEIVAEGAFDETGTTIRDRVEALGGSLDTRSEPGPRTVWAGSFPSRR